MSYHIQKFDSGLKFSWLKLSTKTSEHMQNQVYKVTYKIIW